MELHTRNTHAVFEAIYLFLAVQLNGKGENVTLLNNIFLAFWNALRKNEWRFWNAETNIDNKGIFLWENFGFENLTKFDLGWPDIDLSSGQIKNKNNATIEFSVPNDS